VPDQGKVYCAGSDEHRIAVVDCYQNRVVGILHVPGVPRVLYYSPMAGRLYCGLEGERGLQLAILDVSADTIVRMLSLPFIPQRWCENSVNRKLYLTAASDLDTVVTLSAGGDSILGRFSVLPGVGAMAYNPVRNRVYCASSTDNKVVVLDGSVDTLVATVMVQGDPEALCYAPLRDFMCCACRDGNCVVVIDCASNSVRRLTYVGLEPLDLVYNPTGQKLYVADYGVDSISVIDGTTMLELTRVKACDGPERLAVDTAGNKIYCAGWNKPGLAVIDGDNDSLIREFELEERVCRMTWSERFRRLYVCHIHQHTNPFLTAIEDTLVGGIQGSGGRCQVSSRVGPTVVRNVLVWSPTTPSLRNNGQDRDCPSEGGPVPALLLDVSGRKVLDLHPGENDLRALAPGAYFLRTTDTDGKPTTSRLVIVD
jgi:YVTN family beta-propeller protein